MEVVTSDMTGVTETYDVGDVFGAGAFPVLAS
jgi:hypothetical protein